MTGSALFDFLIALVGLGLVVWLFFLAIDKIGPDEFFKKVAKVAVGGVALIAMLVAAKGVLFGGGGGLVVTPLGIIQFAVGLLVAMVVIYLLYLLIDYFSPPFKDPIKYVVGAVVLIALLVLAGQVLFGGVNYIDLGGKRRGDLIKEYAPNASTFRAAVTGRAAAAPPGGSAVDL